MPKMTANPMGGQNMAPPAPGGGLAGLFGGGSSDPARLEAALAMLNSAQQGAQGGTNPLLAFLMPVMAGVMGPKITERRDTAQAEAAARMTETLLGPQGMSPSARAALEVMNNPNAPDYLQTIAQTMFKNGLTMPGQPASRGGGRSGGRSAGSGGNPAQTRLFGEYNVGGFLSGRDAYGNMVPYKDQNGQPIPFGGGGSAAPAAAAAPVTPLALPPDPVIPQDPQTPAMPSDPLGLRS